MVVLLRNLEFVLMDHCFCYLSIFKILYLENVGEFKIGEKFKEKVVLKHTDKHIKRTVQTV